MKIYELAKEQKDYVVSMRRYFHENPELSGKEIHTIERIAKELDDMGVEYVIVENGGIIATIEGTQPGKTVLLRADCDALPVTEDPTNLAGARTCCSKNDGVMHACGHDGHTAMLLGAAKLLVGMKDQIKGKVICMFERGEEGTGNVVYLLAYLEKHHINVDSSWGIHLYAMLDSGKIGIITGGVMAAVMPFSVTIKGRGGHGSRPDQSVSPIDCFAAINQALMGARLQRIDPFEALTYSICTVHSGTVGNVIPNELTFAGTARSFNRDKAGLPFREEFVKIVDGICAAYNCTANYDRLSGPMFSVFNDSELAELARKAVGAEIGADKVCQPEPWMASESFSSIQKMYPGVFALLGVQNEKNGSGAPHHNAKFDLDEDVFTMGVAGAVSYALAFLNSDVDTSARKWDKGYKELLRMSGNTEERIKEIYGE